LVARRFGTTARARATTATPGTDRRPRPRHLGPRAKEGSKKPEIYGFASVRVVAHRVEERHPEDLEVEPQRPVLDVVEVVLDALVDGGVAGRAVHLRPAGDARLHAVAEHVLRDLVLELAHEGRPLGARADDRHVAGEDVPELR